jgi:predicted dehydrogenase
MTKLNWGMIGGGEGSQIGPAHRLGAQADGNFDFVAGALDHRPKPDANMVSGWALQLTAPMATGARCWRARRTRDDRVDLVTVATPNATHFEITKAFLEAGFHVLCEKPMTMTVEEGEEIVRVARPPAGSAR